MGLEPERCDKLSIISSCIFCVASLLLTLKKTFVALQFAHPMTQKSLNLINE
jgi:hypothetical protein